jgi:glycosyltransferase involved in cell wall biosynthesis
MIRLSQIFQRGAGPKLAAAPSDFLDVYHATTMEALGDSRGLSLGDWGVGDAETVETTPRLILGMLRERKELRRRFPHAVSGEGAAFREWLLAFCVRELKLAPAALANISAAFVPDPAGPVREFYLHTPEVQWRYPLGLLPVGQKRFAKWLIGKSREQHQLSDEQILWFLHATAEDLPRYIALTYLINPEWQERFPEGVGNPVELLAWLRRAFRSYGAFRTVRELPSIKSPGSTQSANTLTGVNVLSHFCYPSGIQQAGLELKFALQAAALRTSCRDVPAGVYPDLSSREQWLGIEPYPITITNVAPAPHFAERYRRAGLLRRGGLLNIAYWAWELDSVPPEWPQLATSLDEIWAPTPFVSQALRSVMTVPVIDMLPGVGVREVEQVSREALGIAEDEVVFLFMFDMRSDFQRKNPLGVVRAFERAFRPTDKARLILKVSRGASDPKNLQRLRDAIAQSRVLLIDEVVSRAKVFGYIAISDCVVSLHRSEGFGLLLAEAMLLRKPVIATNYSGNTAFMNRENSLLVDYELVPVTGSGPIYRRGRHWAEPSVEHAAEYMRLVFEKGEEAEALALRGKSEALEQLSPVAAGNRMRARLEELWRRRASE